MLREAGLANQIENRSLIDGHACGGIVAIGEAHSAAFEFKSKAVIERRQARPGEIVEQKKGRQQTSARHEHATRLAEILPRFGEEEMGEQRRGESEVE